MGTDEQREAREADRSAFAAPATGDVGGPDAGIEPALELLGPIDPSRAACTVCSRPPVSFIADVRAEPGDLFAVGRPVLLCTRCRTLIATGNRFLLTTVLSSDMAEWGRDRMAQHLLERVGRTIPAVGPPPEVVRLRAEGFELLGYFTGEADVATLWPAEHRVALSDPHRDMSTDGPVWMVRPPWPSITLDEVFELLWRWVERDGDPEESVVRARMAEVFGWSTAQAATWLDLSRNP